MNIKRELKQQTASSLEYDLTNCLLMPSWPVQGVYTLILYIKTLRFLCSTLWFTYAISLDSHTISVKEVELHPHFSERQRILCNERMDIGSGQS